MYSYAQYNERANAQLKNASIEFIERDFAGISANITAQAKGGSERAGKMLSSALGFLLGTDTVTSNQIVAWSFLGVETFDNLGKIALFGVGALPAITAKDFGLALLNPSPSFQPGQLINGFNLMSLPGWILLARDIYTADRPSSFEQAVLERWSANYSFIKDMNFGDVTKDLLNNSSSFEMNSSGQSFSLSSAHNSSNAGKHSSDRYYDRGQMERDVRGASSNDHDRNAEAYDRSRTA